MPIVRLPLLQDKISAENVLNVYAEAGKQLAVVSAGGAHHVIMLDASRMPSTIRGFETKSGKSTFNFVGMTLSKEHLVARGSTWIDVAVDAQLSVLLAAPQYVCPKKDYRSSNPGICPIHLESLERSGDDE